MDWIKAVIGLIVVAVIFFLFVKCASESEGL